MGAPYLGCRQYLERVSQDGTVRPHLKQTTSRKKSVYHVLEVTIRKTVFELGSGGARL